MAPILTRRTRVRHISHPDGSRIVTQDRDLRGRRAPLTGMAGPRDAVFVAISARGHWRRWDDARLSNGDAVCRGCGRHDSWQRIDDRGACVAPATTAQVEAALTGGAR